MTAVTEIHIDELNDVLAVPVQAVMQQNDQTWCIVKNAQGLQPVAVSLGRSNDAKVEVTAGLEAGDQVALNPTELAPAFFDEEGADNAGDQA